MLESLPIDSIREELLSGLRTRRHFVLHAPTGSGKSTRVPRFLAESTEFGADGCWVVLQPRRIAARLLAARVADEWGCELGTTVGYAMRHETRYRAETKVLFVTEGWLLRRLLWEKDWSWMVGVVLDEFHERHLEGDVLLGLLRRACLNVWQGRIGVMSATLEGTSLMEFLEDVVEVRAEGRTYPVDVSHVSGGVGDRLSERVIEGLRRALNDGAESDYLVFVPGKGEIFEMLRRLEGCGWARGYELCSLHGEMSLADQRRVVGTGERPRIIVSTNVAESSLTLPRVRTVIDSGYERVAAYDARRGLNSLMTERISLASARQRAGRAGRLAPGRCYRVWKPADEGLMASERQAEIRRLDLSALRLELEAAGVGENFSWFECPPEEAWLAAGDLLDRLGASHLGKVNELGSRMARLPLHPRHSRILLEAAELRALDWVVPALALLESRGLILPLHDKQAEDQREEWLEDAEGKSDLLRELLALREAISRSADRSWFRRFGIHEGAFREVVKVLTQLCGHAAKQGFAVDPFAGELVWPDFVRCLVIGYPDTLARRVDRGTLRYQRVGGKVATLRRESVVRNAELVVSADMLEQDTKAGRVVLMGMNTAVDVELLRGSFPQSIERVGEARLIEDQRRVEWVQSERFLGLTIREGSGGSPAPGEAARLLAEALAHGRWQLPKWDVGVDNWIARLNTLANWCPELEIQPFRDEDRLVILEQLCDGAVSYREVKDREVLELVQQWLPEALLPLMDKWVPERFPLPDGRSAKLRYESPQKVILPARIQQLYDVPGKSLTICDGRCPLLVELLAPNQRPVQITADLDAFWTGQYPQVRKDLFGRYPKHEWR